MSRFRMQQRSSKILGGKDWNSPDTDNLVVILNMLVYSSVSS
jgi:hypothetical protein